MFNKAIQIIAKTFTAEENIRPTLAWVYFKWNKITATNSFKLIEVTRRDFNTESLVKSKNGFEYITNEEIDFMIPNKAILDIRFPKNKNFPFIENAYFWNLVEDSAGKRVAIMTNDLEQEKIHNTNVMEWKFPEYKDWFKQKWEIKQFWLWVWELLELCQAMQKLWHRQLKFSVADPLSPIVIEWEELEEFNTRTIIMPLKI